MLACIPTHRDVLRSARSVAALTAALCVAFLSACGGSEETTETAAGSPAKPEKAAAKLPVPRPKPSKYVPIEPLSEADEAQLAQIEAAVAGDPAVLVEAILAVAKSTQHPEVLVVAIDELESIRTPEAAQAIGEFAPTAKRVEVRLRAIEAYDYIGGPASKELIFALLSDADASVRQEAAYELTFIVTPDDAVRLQPFHDKEQDRAVKEELAEAIENAAMERSADAAQAADASG